MVWRTEHPLSIRSAATGVEPAMQVDTKCLFADQPGLYDCSAPVVSSGGHQERVCRQAVGDAQLVLVRPPARHNKRKCSAHNQPARSRLHSSSLLPANLCIGFRRGCQPLLLPHGCRLLTCPALWCFAGSKCWTWFATWLCGTPCEPGCNSRQALACPGLSRCTEAILNPGNPLVAG